MPADFNTALTSLIKQAVAEAIVVAMPASGPVPPPEIAEIEILKHKEYLSGKDVEKLYGLKSSTLRAWRGQGRGPSYSRDGDLILYRRIDVEAYLKSNKVRTYSQPGS